MNNTLPPPATFGLPEKFSEWRENQDVACESQLDPAPRFLVQNAPTGFGKSVVYMTAAQLVEGRTVILTSTKGLQSQLIKDFGGIAGVTDIRGRVNYTCRLNTKFKCDTGLCVFGVKCVFREEGGCFYFDALKKARCSKVVITNYSYWMSQNEYSEGIGQFDMLVLDEAHAVPNHVADHVGVSFDKTYRFECRRLELDGSLPNDHSTWRWWAQEYVLELEIELEEAKENRKLKLAAQIKRLLGKLKRVAEMGADWVWEDGQIAVDLSPTWPAPYAESHLFLGIPKVILTSATVVPKTADLLGISGAKCEFEQFPSTFPLANRPLIHVPTIRMNYKVTEMEDRIWINKIDNIIKDRLGTKGIIHTVSYARRDKVLAKSRFRDHMVTHNRKDTESQVQQFKSADPPAILISPSMATGWDFPYGDCRWQIMPKLPYPDSRGEIMKKRAAADKDYIAYIVMQLLIQATGRGCRAADDWCETFILDDNIQWFLEQNQHLSVDWFAGAYRVSKAIPKPIGGA